MTNGISASLLPNGKQQFLSSDGVPLAGGSVYFYVPNTSTPKTTWLDPYQNVANANPVVLDSAGEAIIYGSGQYRQVVYDALTNLIWDQLTASNDITNVVWCGIATGTANALVLTPSPAISGLTVGAQYLFEANATNTGSVTVDISGTGAFNLLKPGLNGPTALTGNELNSGQVGSIIWEGTEFQLASSYQQPAVVPSGAGFWWPTSTPPQGFLEANGQSTAGYPNLIAIYGANLPDMRGCFARGWDHDRGLDPNDPTLLEYVADELASHTHTTTDFGHYHTPAGGSGFFTSGSGTPASTGTGVSITNDPTTSTSVTGLSINSTGGAETAPKYIAWMFIIKT